MINIKDMLQENFVILLYIYIYIYILQNVTKYKIILDFCENKVIKLLI